MKICLLEKVIPTADLEKEILVGIGNYFTNNYTSDRCS